MSYEDTRLWQAAFGHTVTEGDSTEAKARNRLRNSYIQFREKAATLAAEISRELPALTVHDITHLDALWEMADLVLLGAPEEGREPTFNALETFVLGCSFLTHDLAQSKAALDLSSNDLASDALYRDILAGIVKPRLEQHGGSGEATAEEKEMALSQFLRERHAAAAETLPFVAWKHSSGPIFLIDDQELRQYLGEAIGKVAASHHWPVRALGDSFDEKLGCPTSLPLQPCDLLKIACLLRLADGAHLDARRAPSFLQSLRKPTGYSEVHWRFQNHLLQPQAKDDRIVFTSGPSFENTEIDAWWLCFDTLSYLDSQLASVDSLLTDFNRSRFTIKAVAGIEDPKRLSKLIKTKDWLPVDTHIRVGNVASLVLRLGGEQLYGNSPTVPLRELIQNAGDAIQARRAIDPLFSGGAIKVSLAQREDKWVLVVRDDGVGMSESVLTGALIDFGASFWKSADARREFPGLARSNFRSTGRYGIGFFSVFMLGEDVKITSRRFNDVTHGAKVLHFRKGADSRPILSDAVGDLKHLSGTIVEITLRKDPFENGGLISNNHNTPTSDFGELCSWLCPAFPVKIEVSFRDAPSAVVVDADDWKIIPADVLLQRILRSSDKREQKYIADFIAEHSTRMRIICRTDGTVIGRAALAISYLGLMTEDGESLVVTVGGCRATSTYYLAGVMLGESSRASRDAAKFSGTWDDIARWAEEQVDLLTTKGKIKNNLYLADQMINLCGIEREELILAKSNKGSLTKRDLVKFAKENSKIIVLDRSAEHEITKNREVIFSDNVLLCTTHLYENLSSFIDGVSPGKKKWGTDEKGQSTYLFGPAITTLAEVWDVPRSSIVRNEDDTEEEQEELQLGVDKYGEPVMGRSYTILDRGELEAR